MNCFVQNVLSGFRSSKHTEAMHALQKALSSPLVLCLPNFQKAFQLETNASDFVIGGVLS